jgi:hypothetical protein
VRVDVPVQENPLADVRAERGQRRPATHEIPQHGAQPERFVVAGQHQVSEEIHAPRLAYRDDGFWPAPDHLRYHARILRRPAAPGRCGEQNGILA